MSKTVAESRQTKQKPATKRPLRVVIGYGSCGIAAGAQEVYEVFATEIKANNLQAELGITGCLGLCFREVLVDIETAEGKYTYGDVTPKTVSRIIESHLKGGRPVKEWLVLSEGLETVDSKFLSMQKRIVLRNCGLIDPENMADYLSHQGYEALRKVLTEMSPEQVIEEIKSSGLRGRGGAGFPTGLKWELTRQAEGDQKYIICNADEGDPGAFMDRSVLEGDPHSVLEGMTIAGYTVGADKGYLYVRAEYPLAIRRLKLALEQATKRGLCGKGIMGTDFSFDIEIKVGAGAFVCGEETALMASIEGKRGMPRLRPPFPAISGLWNKPTNINNVETYANVAWIIQNGAEQFSAVGTAKSKGTKVFALTGKVKRTGLVEVPMGMTLREVIFDIGGGIADDGEFKAVQIGGPSGGCLSSEHLDTPVDYESLSATGAIMGSGGMVVADKHTCMVDLAKFFLDFIRKESCGKCVPCRIGTTRMYETLDRMTRGGQEEDLETLAKLARDVKTASLCGLGQTAPNPVMTTMRYFKDEYEAHVKERRCFAGVCRELAVYIIKENVCTGCGVCKKRCPAGAIAGNRKEPHHIDDEKCLKCGICLEHCVFDAIYKT